MLSFASDFFQVAWIVDDLDARVREWIEVQGVGPFFVAYDLPMDNAKLLGASCSWTFHAALAQAGDLQIELIQPVSDGVYRRQQDPDEIRMRRINHLAKMVDDLDAAVGAYESHGAGTYISGQSGTVRFAYMDTRATLGVYTELAETCDVLTKLRQSVATAAESWDGKNPIRSLAALLG